MLQSKSKKTIFSRFLSNPARVIASSFALLVIIGTFLLMLPISTRDAMGTSFLDALFTATSATCVTGLVIKDTFTHFSIFGQSIILFLIQLGGLGLVTFATFFNIAIRKKIGLKSLYVAKESVNSNSMFDMGRLIKMIFLLTLIFELIGAVALSTVFVPKYGSMGIFISVFISISAYCNAGFDILGFEGQFSSLTSQSSEPLVLITIMALIICGGLGFIVWQDLYGYRHREKLMLHTKIVLISSVVLIIIGTFIFGLFEWNNISTIGEMSNGDKILNSFFQSITTRTAGFNTIPIENTLGVTRILMIFLMFIGAAPGSTGGGVKITTAYVLFMTIVCVIQGKDETIIGGRKVDKSLVYKSLSVLFIGIIIVFLSTATIYFTSHSGVVFSELDAFFESVSAFATVGLSSGVTALANTASKIVLIITMFIGRVGPVSLALSLAMRHGNKSKILPEAKIMVG